MLTHIQSVLKAKPRLLNLVNYIFHIAYTANIFICKQFFQSRPFYPQVSYLDFKINCIQKKAR